MFGLFKKKAGVTKLDRSMLVPRIKTTQFTAALRNTGVPTDQMPYTEPLVADLLVTYAFDLPGMFQMASAASIAELGIPLAEVRSIALDNLKRQIPQIGFQELGPIRQIITGNELEACTLLATSFWDDMANEAHGEIVAGVPSRDVLMFSASEMPEGIALLREVVTDVLTKETTHGLTERLLVWRGSCWMEYAN
jgi:uncharacterized protein YtpQ (UPF0354 family)